MSEWFTTISVRFPNSILCDAATEAGCSVQDVLDRLHGLYEANLYEDLKWVVHDILESGVDHG